MKKYIKLLTLFALTAMASIHSVRANVHVWSGAQGSVWAWDGNWSSGGAPVPGEPSPVVLEFPATGVTTFDALDNIPNLVVDYFIITGDNYSFPFFANLTFSGAPPSFPFYYNFTCAGTNVLIDPTVEFVLNGTNSFYVGPGDDLTFAGDFTGAGGLTKVGLGAFTMANTTPNTYTGATTVSAGTLNLSATNQFGAALLAVPGPLVIGDPTNAPDYAVVRLLSPEQIADGMPVIVNKSGLLDLNNNLETIGSLAGSGNVWLEFTTLTAGGDGISTTFSGSITGTGIFPLIKEGAGSLVLTGTNTCSGTMYVDHGDLYANGMQTCGVQANTQGKLHGIGTVGAISGGGGMTIPGDNLAAPTHGRMSSASLVLDNNSSFNIDIGGTAASGNYDQLIVGGVVNLGNATFHLTQSGQAKTDDHFVIIKNNGGGAVNGTFAGIAEGQVLNLGPAQQLQITYKGGASSNDVVLTQLAAPPAASNITKITNLGNGQIQIIGTGLSGLDYDVQANANLASTNWITIGTVQAAANGAISFTDTNATSFPMRFYRFKAD